jgi:parvulin-like peptidyl-prolyl isomerase
MRLINILVFVSMVSLAQESLAQQDQTLPEGIMAIRGSGEVSRQLFDAKISRIPVEDRTGVLRSSERLQKILADLLITEQLIADAKAAGFDKGDIQYRMKLAADTELANAWLDHYANIQSPADYEAMAHEYYLLNKDSIKTPPTRDVTHILVSNKDRSEEELTTLAQSYLEMVKLNPSVFEELIMEHSDDPSADTNKGHFKGVKKGDMVKPFEDASFSLIAPGDFSGLVKSAYGIHIIRLDKITSSETLGFEEVKNRLMSMQKKAHKERLRYTYLSELGTMEWQVSEEAIKEMVDDYFAEDQPQENSKAADSE